MFLLSKYQDTVCSLFIKIASFIDLSSYEIVLLRTFIGSVLLIALFFLTRNKLTFYQYKNDSLFLLLSGIAMGTSWMFLYEAYVQIGVSIASLCYYCGPVIVMALSPLLFREKLTASKLCGFAAVLIGIILVNGSAFYGNSNLWGLLRSDVSRDVRSYGDLQQKSAAYHRNGKRHAATLRQFVDGIYLCPV